MKKQWIEDNIGWGGPNLNSVSIEKCSGVRILGHPWHPGEPLKMSLLHLGLSAKPILTLQTQKFPTVTITTKTGITTTDYEFWKWGDCKNL